MPGASRPLASSETLISLADQPREERNERLLELAGAGELDFLDFGTHKGGSLRVGESLGGRRGLGVDIDDAKAVNALRRGDAVWSGDVAEFPFDEPVFGFGICRHVLEHLPNLGIVHGALRKMQSVCRDFLYVEGPDFSTERVLAPLGLTMAHTTTVVHTCHLTADDVAFLLADLGITSVLIGGKLRIDDSSNPWVHAATAPPNRSKWSERDPPKPHAVFRPAIHRDFVLLADVSADGHDLDRVASLLRRATFDVSSPS